MLCSSILIDFVMIAEQNGFLWWSVHVLMTHYVHQVKHANETQPAECHAIQASVSHVAEGPPGKPYNTHKAKKTTNCYMATKQVSSPRLQSSAAGEWTGQTERYRGTHIQTQSHLFTHICQREVLLPRES